MGMMLARMPWNQVKDAPGHLLCDEGGLLMKLLIVGGVAGGASAAARARRLSEDAHIILFERGPDVSFANCGLPYYLGGEIAERDKLLVVTPERLRTRFNLDVRVRTSVEAIDRAAKKVRVRDLASGREYEETYDKLILAPGAAPLRPPLPGIDLPGIFTLRNLQDVDRIKARIDQGVKQAVVIGAGFIGLELVENFVRRGIATTVVELQDQVLPPFDKEMTTPIAEELASKGVSLLLGQSAEAFEQAPDGLVVRLKSGQRLPAQLVILGVGVRPENKLAVEAGLEVGPRGGIRVNEHLQTSDPDIYAVGDAIEVKDFVTGEPTQVPLAGPANRQGRIAADNIFGRSARYRGTQGTAIVRRLRPDGGDDRRFGEGAAAGQPALPQGLRPPDAPRRLLPRCRGDDAEAALRPDDGPGAGRAGRGRGRRGQADRRAGRGDPGGHDGLRPGGDGTGLLAAVRLGQRPDQHGGFVAGGLLRGDHPQVDVEAVLAAPAGERPFLLDVRTPQEFAGGHIPGAVNIPVDDLRSRLGELPRDREIAAYCQVGQRGYLATRILLQAGFQAANVGGGYKTYRLFRPEHQHQIGVL